jgi:catechol 2,3-dioxygenase-like lactoylglutathione lyase family enzyme
MSNTQAARIAWHGHQNEHHCHGRECAEAATASGAEVLHQPRVWPEYHASYYGAFVRDPDGNNVEAVCHQPG